jgi:hypothetical protein
LNESPKVWVVPFVGLVDADVHVATGAPSTGSKAVVLAASTAAEGPELPAESVTLPARIRAWRVPAEQPETVTVMAVPDDEAGVNAQLTAVPAFSKSAASTPVIVSFEVSVYVPVDAIAEPGVAVNDIVGAVRSIVTVDDWGMPGPFMTVTLESSELLTYIRDPSTVWVIVRGYEVTTVVDAMRLFDNVTTRTTP